MAMVQDELGNYYDDGTGGGVDTSYSSPFGIANYGDQPEGGGDGFHDFTGVTANPYGNMPSVDEDFSPTYGQFGLPPGVNTRSLGVGGANAMPSVDADFAPTYPITGGGIGGRTVVGGGNGITDFLKSLNLTNAGGIAGALAGATGAFTNKPQKAYEGKIPQLQAIRNMVTAPPTTNYRPGQGGVNYNADVFYAPRGTVPEGMMGTMTPAAQVAAANAAKANTTAAKKNSTLTNIAKTAGLAALAKQVLGGTGNKTTDGLKTIIDKITGGTGTKTVPGTGTGTTTGTGTKTVPGAGTGTNNAGVIGAATKAVTGAGGAGTPTKSGGGGGGGGGGAGAGSTTGTGGLTTPEGEYAGADEFEGIDAQVAANANDLAEPPVLSDEEVDAELARVAAETDDIYGTGGDGTNTTDIIGGDSFHDFTGVDDAVINNTTRGFIPNLSGGDDGYYDPTNDMSNTNYSGFDFDGFDFGSNDLDLSEFDLGNGDYSNFDFGGGDDFNFDLADYDFARGGRINMAKGRYLQGNTDGMADKIPARIGQKQPAALSHGEFVVPADVVSHLGNGNSDAGAKKLYQMMDRIRVARTGNKEQGRQINPDKFMPGGLTNAYANGGKVQGFAGPDGSAVGATGLGAAVGAGITGTETGPNSFAGDYISNMLGKTQALTESPYLQYMGPLTAGASGLQNQVFTGLQNTNFPGNLGQSFSSQGAYAAPTMGASGATPTASLSPTTPAAPGQSQGIASQYMNPYLQNVLDPQLAELRRQNDITNMSGNAKMAQAGAFGGGRQAIMNAENNRNMMQEMNKTVGQGYASAYDRGQQQFNAEQAQGRSLADLMAQQGNVQRGIEAEGMAADKSAFEAARENPYKMLQFQQSMLNGLPVSATSYNIAQPTKLQEIMAGASGGAKALTELGKTPEPGTNTRTVADLLKQLGL